jgi:hypothetical protein
MGATTDYLEERWARFGDDPRDDWDGPDEPPTRAELEAWDGRDDLDERFEVGYYDPMGDDGAS